jgi:RHS repeat-associated protein
VISRLSVALLIWIAFLNGAEAQTVGRTPGHFDVSAVGSAQYSIPIWAPPGPRGMQPNISLSYDSQSSIGPLGIGWSLAGLGQITRCNLTAAQDTTPAPVALVTTDGYCINGNRLRLTGGTYGAAGSTYQTEIADFSQITANGNTTSGGVNTGPASFTVQARNGLKYYYGFTDSFGNGVNSEVLANGSTTALMWLLSKVVDRAGNNYVINYLAPSASLSGTSVPNKILWTPATAGSSSYTYTMQFNYGTNPPQSSINQYVAGTLVSNTELLTSIEIFLGTTVVKDYFLSYQASPLTGREELIKVKECADAAGSNCLIPTTVGYQTGSPGLSTVSNSALTSSGAGLTARYDLNGDGYPDLVYINGTTLYVAFGSASGYGTPFSTGVPGGGLVGRLMGGSQDGFLAINSGVWWYYTWNGTSFVGTSTGLAYDSTASQYQLADVDGDGRTDLVAMYITGPDAKGKYTATVYIRLNTSSSGTPSFSATLNAAATSTGLVSAQLLTPDFQYGKLRRYDFNGDGRDDVVLQTTTGTSPSFTVNTFELISTGTTFNTTLIQSVAASAYPTMFFTDWNDDKCTDVVTLGTLYVSGCNGTVPVSYSIGTVVAAIDYDGDGRTDLLVPNGSTLGVYLSKATGAPTLTATPIPYVASCQYVWMDANGDGLDDLGCWSQTSPSPLTYYLHNGTSDLATSFADGYGNSASPTYVPISQSNYVEHGYGEATFPEADYIGPMYVVSEAVYSDPSAAPGTTYNQTFQYFGAWMNLQGRGFDGFAGMYFQDSRNNIIDLRYYYRAFPYTGMMDNNIVWNGSQFFSAALGTATYTELSTTTNQQRYFPYFNNWTIQKWEAGGVENGDLITTTSTNYTFDNYGNATNIVKTVTDNDPGTPYNGYTWTTNTTNTTDISANQSADLAAWCLNMLDQTQVAYSSTFPGSTSVTRTKKFTPDTPSACRIMGTVTEPLPTTNPYKVTEALTFDGFGNIATDTVTGNNMPSSPASRLTTLNWSTTGQFLTSVTDPSGAITTSNYTSNQGLTFGVPDSIKNPNSLTTSWLYDAFGRKSKETRPDGTSTTWTWNTCTSFCGWSNSFYQIAQSAYQSNGTTVIRTNTNLYDPVGRVTQTSGPTVTGATAVVLKTYNSLGLLIKQSMPYTSGAPAYSQRYAYDVLNRLVEIARPINASSGIPSCVPTLPLATGCQGSGYSYAGRKLTVTDPYGNTKTIIKDVNGWLRQTKDAVGYNIARAFDAAGSLTSVADNVGNALLSGVTYAYGLKPFRLAATDADRGAWTYTVDSLGERTGWTDAKGQSFAMTYDALSRPLTRTEPDLFTQWTWGSTPASHNVGQMIAECTQTVSPCSSTSALYYESRAFDSDGRPSTRAITESGNPGNDPGGVFLFTSTYSATTGFPNTLSYPISTSGVALNIQYGYQNGLLQSVTDTTDTTTTCGTTCTLWTANAMNAFGEITQETLGNGVVMNRSYDAVTSWLSGATAGVGGGATLLNQSYLEDENGNVIQRQNNTLGLTESFAYDADQRLSCAALSSTCSTPTMAYDGGVKGPGNITSQTGVGTYTYPAAGQPRPHAVTSLTGTFNGITNPSFSYDANGNMTNRAGSIVAWSSYNYPVDISASDASGAEDVQLSYGPDRQRWKQIYTAPGVTENTYYIGGLMDKVFSGGTTDYRHYIYAGKEPVAVYSRTAAANTMSYMLEDHQGGVSNMASKSGTSDVNESFSAFGSRRNPATWSGAPTTADLNTIAGLSRQGYTMQTWLGQSMGLNHMNGRVEDAILGRFLSPDPHITDPSNAQNYNRYSYVNNNPMSYTDPSGFCGTSGPTLKAAASISCGSGVSIPAGSVQGLSGFSDDGFGNLDDVGTPDPPSAASIAATANAGNAAASAQLDGSEAAAIATIGNDLAGSTAQSQNSNDDPDLQPIAVTAQRLGGPADACPECASVTVTSSRGPSYLDRYVNFVSDNAINVGPYASALFGGLWPKSWAPATNFRPPLLGSSNPLTSVPRAFGVTGADSVLVQTGAAGIGLVTVGVGFYDLTIELEGFLYAIPSQ